jgi:hypothetical protein
LNTLTRAEFESKAESSVLSWQAGRNKRERNKKARVMGFIGTSRCIG